MRILYNSKDLQYKTPFGCLTPGQSCTLRIQIPTTVLATGVACVLLYDDGTTVAQEIGLGLTEHRGPYEVWAGDFSIPYPGLYFYFFRISNTSGGFRLFKVGDDPNMEAGDLWQLSCVPADFHTPHWAKGATIYQVFPDRFH